MKKIIIAIDGFSSCGKSTMAKALARNIGYLYFDSGAMYRAVALYCLRNGLIEEGVINTEKLRKQLAVAQKKHRISSLRKYAALF